MKTGSSIKPDILKQTQSNTKMKDTNAKFKVGDWVIRRPQYVNSLWPNGQAPLQVMRVTDAGDLCFKFNEIISWTAYTFKLVPESNPTSLKDQIIETKKQIIETELKLDALRITLMNSTKFKVGDHFRRIDMDELYVLTGIRDTYMLININRGFRWDDGHDTPTGAVDLEVFVKVETKFVER